MLPNPLHPAIVHFPLVLAMLLPILALGALWAIRRGTTPRKAWAFPAGVAAALALSAWVSVETGESAGEKVEKVVAEQPLESHEESAEAFLAMSAGLALLVGAGLAGGRLGRAARILGTVGTAGLAFAAIQVGHSGGQLVYRYGAASAYVQDSAAAKGASPSMATSEEEH